MDWRSELGSILEKNARLSRAERENAEFENFLQKVAIPAMNDLATELRNKGRAAVVRRAPAALGLTVSNGDHEEITFRLLRRSAPDRVIAVAEVKMRKGQRLVGTEAPIKDSLAPLDETTGDDIIACFLKYYAQVLESSPAPYEATHE